MKTLPGANASPYRARHYALPRNVPGANASPYRARRHAWRSSNSLSRQAPCAPAQGALPRKVLIGLTGGIGSGKTTALREFARCGARTLDLDQVSRELSRPGRPGSRRILKAFGPAVMDSKGGVDREKLANLVFSSRPLLRRLERLTHPLILSAMRRWAARPSARPSVIDVPLLFEKRLGSEFDAVLMVTASRNSRLVRVSRRDRVSRKAVSRRMAAQWPEQAKKRRADVTVANEGSANDLRRKIREYYKAFELIHRRT